MAIAPFLSVGSRRSSVTPFSSLNLWRTLLPTSRRTAVKVATQMAETRWYHHHSPKKTYSYSSAFSIRLPFSVFQRYYSSTRHSGGSSPSCFNVDEPVTSRIRHSTNGPGENQPMKKLPIGIQSIREVLTEGHVYADKTGHAKHLIDSGKHYFLSRPRRFGKSLFLDTLREIFKGNKELFRECQIYDSDYNWQEYPVIYLDFSKITNTTPEILEISLKEALQDIAGSYKESVSGATSQSQLSRLTTVLSKRAPVVILLVNLS